MKKKKKRKKEKEKKKDTTPPNYTIYQNKLKMDKGLNISHDTIKVLEENTGRKISDIPHSNIFANTSPRAREIKEKINKCDHIKLKSIYTAKETIIKMEREPTEWENLFANDTPDKGMISKIHKEFMGTLLHCWWEYRLVQPLQKIVWNFLKNLKMELSFDPVIPLLGLYPKKLKSPVQRTESPQCSYQYYLQ